MKSTLIAVFLAAFVSLSFSWPFPGNQEEFKQEADKFAKEKLKEFDDAINNKDNTALKSLLSDVLHRLNTTQQHHIEFLTEFANVTQALKVLSNLDLNSKWTQFALMALLKVMNPHPDYVSFYGLEGAKNWIDERVNVTEGDVEKGLLGAKLSLDYAQISFPSDTSEFKYHVNSIIDLMSNGTAGENADEIRLHVVEMDRDANQTYIINLTQTAIHEIVQVIEGL